MKAAFPMLALLLLVTSAAAATHTDDGVREERLFGVISTSSVTRIASTTITALTTCLSVSSTPCLGRRKKSVMKLLLAQTDENETPFFSLESSKAMEFDVDEQRHQEDEEEERGNGGEDAEEEADESSKIRKKRGALTIWSSVFTTITVTSTVAQAGTTITASALCSAPGIVAGCFLG
ncbi:uncharacterized protein [Cherax quadricarinatus]|uniref:uncharacterized protein n=1 Tax=Cherax quadricarinatus TaxID=27406 RepID=UPI00387E6AAA